MSIELKQQASHLCTELASCILPCLCQVLEKFLTRFRLSEAHCIEQFWAWGSQVKTESAKW